MEVRKFKSGAGVYALTAVVTRCGEDMVVTIGGGTAPHVGAVALGLPRLSLKQDGSYSASVSVFCVPEHKDDELARLAALELASGLRTRVVVTVGLHVDVATREELGALQANFVDILEQISDSLVGS